MRTKYFLKTIPLVTSFFLIILNNSIPPPPGYGFVIPSISIVCLIYWSLKKISDFNVLDAAIIGLLSDFIIGTPIGSSVLLFIFTRTFLLWLCSRIDKNNSLINSVIIFLSISFYYFFSYIFIILYFNKQPVIKNYLMGYILTLFLYPLVSIIFNWLMKLKFLQYYENK